ncbi:unnamed protein product, partial [marine sediment metagenome]
CGRVSRKAAQPLRQWVRKHNIPVVTVTHYSGACRLDSKKVEGDPYYFDLRDRETRSVQYPLDGVIWGQSNCFYYYYGAHPGRGRGSFIFDEFGRVKPLFHFYAAANHLIGGHSGTESIDDFVDFRVGLVRMRGKKGMAVLYSVDGKIYDFSLDAAGISGVLDGLGNPVKRWRKDGRVQYHVSRHPVYLAVEDIETVRRNIRNIRFEDKLPVRFKYSIHPAGILQVRAIINCRTPLKAEVE